MALGFETWFLQFEMFDHLAPVATGWRMRWFKGIGMAATEQLTEAGRVIKRRYYRFGLHHDGLLCRRRTVAPALKQSLRQVTYRFCCPRGPLSEMTAGPTSPAAAAASALRSACVSRLSTSLVSASQRSAPSTGVIRSATVCNHLVLRHRSLRGAAHSALTCSVKRRSPLSTTSTVASRAGSRFSSSSSGSNSTLAR